MFDTFRTTTELYLARLSIPSPWETDLMGSVTILAGGVSFLFFVLFLFSNRSRTLIGERPGPVRQLLRKARKAEKKGNFSESGELYFCARRYKEAARAFVKTEDYERAGDACLLNNDFSNAAKCFVRTGGHEKAAELFIKARDYASAAENLVAIGKMGEAAPLFPMLLPGRLLPESRGTALRSPAVRARGTVTGENPPGKIQPPGKITDGGGRHRIREYIQDGGRLFPEGRSEIKSRPIF